ncbi:MAG: NrtR DNA-binding winged helix domain-containing protein, partial [Flavobacteriales bacterium]
QRLYEILLDEKLDKRNFRKNISKINIIKKTSEKEEGVPNKPAYLYTYGEKK